MEVRKVDKYALEIDQVPDNFKMVDDIIEDFYAKTDKKNEIKKHNKKILNMVLKGKND